MDLNIFWNKIWIEIKLSLEDHSGNIRNHDPAFTNLIAEFNARSKSWLVPDITNNEGMQIESLSSLYGFCQLILKKN